MCVCSTDVFHLYSGEIKFKFETKEANKVKNKIK